MGPYYASESHNNNIIQNKKWWHHWRHYCSLRQDWWKLDVLKFIGVYTKKEFILFFRLRNESKNMVHLRSHHQSNEVWEFRSSRGPTKEVRVLHLAKNLRQVFIFFVVFQQNSLLCRGDDQLCCKLYISNTVQLFDCSLSHSNKVWTHKHFVNEHWTIYSNWPTGL